ncbi:MAG: di-heme oxidoredictase family protein, partial [Verrucomicrobiota bacterium]
GVFGIPHMEPEAEIDISFQTIQGTFADGSSYELLKPIYSLSPNLAHPPPASDATLGPRIANPVFGLGLLEAVPESTILALADPDDHDGDGISGRPNWVWHPVSERKVLGRFGWKANQPDLLSQTSGAFVGDIGITTPIHSQEELTPAQRSLAPPDSSGGSPEITYPLLNRVVTYLQTLAPPARRDVHEEEVILGERLFHQAQCATCHVPKLTTGSFPDLPEVAHQIIQPYTDLLLHDMGNELADGRDDFEATGSEWRTPPLWGIGLTETVNGHTRFLHDGRARNLEEAILWHGGEASTSAQHYREYSLSERKALLRFLDSL